MLTAAQIIEALPHLTPADLTAVRAAIEALQASQTKLDIDLFNAVLTNLGITGSPTILGKTSNYKVWIKNQEVVLELVNRIVGKKPKKAVVLHVKKFVMSLIINHLKASNQEISMRTIAHAMVDVYPIFDDAFPGYLDSGLTHLIVGGLK